MLGPFYSSEVLPPFLVEQVSSLQSKSHPCRASFILAEQVSSLQSKLHPCRASFILVEQVFPLQSKLHPCKASFLKRGGQVWAFVLSGAHTKDGLYLLWACGHRPVDMGLLGSPSLVSYFILFKNNQNPFFFLLIFPAPFFMMPKRSLNSFAPMPLTRPRNWDFRKNK